MRAARREALLALGLQDRRFGYPLEMVVRAAEAGWRIAETAVPLLPEQGKSKVTGTVPRHRADRQGHAPGPRLDSRQPRPRPRPGPGPGPRPPAPAPAQDPGPGTGARTHRAGLVVTADVYTGKHRREGALGQLGAPGAPGVPAPGQARVEQGGQPCWRPRSW